MTQSYGFRHASGYPLWISEGPWGALERFVMDLGFGVIVGHVQEYFGRRLAKLTTGGIVVALALGLLIMVGEVVERVHKLVVGGQEQLTTIALIVFGVAFSIALGFLISVALSHWARTRRFMRETRKMTDYLREAAERVRETQNRSMQILRHSATMAKERSQQAREAVAANPHMSPEEKAARLNEIAAAESYLLYMQDDLEAKSGERDAALRRLVRPDGAGKRP